MSARFLTDEHVPGPFVRVLRSTGHDVLRAKDEFSPGTDDGVLLQFAAETDRIVTTIPAEERRRNEFYLTDWL